MSGQNDNSILLIVFQHCPESSPSSKIHSTSWLIQQNQLRVGNKCESYTELPFVSPAQTFGNGVSMLPYVDIFHDFIDSLVFVFDIEALEVAVDIQMLSYCKEIKQYVLLRAYSYYLTDVLNVLNKLWFWDVRVYQIFTKAGYWSRGGGKHACQHWNCGGFSCSVMTK